MTSTGPDSDGSHGQLHLLNREEILAFIKSCERGCRRISIGYEPHLYTLSASRFLLYDSINVTDINRVCSKSSEDTWGVDKDFHFLWQQLWLFWATLVL